MAENSIDSINRSIDGLNSSYQDYSRIDGSDELVQKSALVNQSVDSVGAVPHNLGNFQNYDHG